MWYQLWLKTCGLHQWSSSPVRYEGSRVFWLQINNKRSNTNRPKFWKRFESWHGRISKEAFPNTDTISQENQSISLVAIYKGSDPHRHVAICLSWLHCCWRVLRDFVESEAWLSIGRLKLLVHPGCCFHWSSDWIVIFFPSYWTRKLAGDLHSLQGLLIRLHGNQLVTSDKSLEMNDKWNKLDSM